jgi:dihydroneopterin triphosphate diphosphatase
MTEILVRVIDCWVFHRLEGEMRFLIMRRSKGLLYEGLYHCVHGKIEKNETAWQAAVRELQEETGLIPKAMWTADFCSQFYEAASDTFNLVPVFACEVDIKDIRLSSEHADYQWLPLKEAQKLLAWNNHKQALHHIYQMFTDNFPQKRWLEVKFDKK